MRTLDGIHYVALALCFVCGLILSILSIHRIFRSWNEQWLIQRNRYLVLLLVGCCIIYLLINVPHTIACALYYGREPFAWPFEQHIWSSLLQNTSLYGIIVGYVGLIHNLYFKHGYENAMSNIHSDKDWYKRSASSQLSKTDWFMRHKQTLGKQWYIAARLILLWMSTITLIEIIFIFHWFGPRRLGLMGIVNLLSVIISILISHRMWQTFPATQDAFHIQHNILFTMRLQAAVVLVLAVPLGIIRIFHTELWLTFGVVAAIAFCLFEYCLVLHPFRLMKDRSVRESLKSLVVETWKEIIEDRDGFDAFMSFLQSRFASESLLFLVDFIQFKSVLTKYKLLDVAHLSRLETGEVIVELPDDLPLSSIMTGFDNTLSATTNWREQFWKAVGAMEARYLTDGAEMELNIECNLKQRMHELVAGKGDSDQRKANVMRELQAIYKEISTILDGVFVDFNGSIIAEAYYKGQRLKENKFIPQVSRSLSISLPKAVALWSKERITSTSS